MGYDPDFISGFEVPLPVPSERVLLTTFERGFIHHTRHSILFNKNRGLASMTAHNIDGRSLPDEQHTSRDFDFDPKIDANLQIGNEQGYKDTPDYYQRGHLARRKSLSWGRTSGEIEDAKRAERESDYYSNIAPQERRMHVAWGKVEDWMLELSEAPSNERRSCVFQGPVFTEEDPEVTITEGYDPVKIPAGFWKVMAIRRGDKLRAAGFLIWQSDYASPEPLSFSPVLEQVRLTTIEVLSGLSFPELRNADAMIFAAEQDQLLSVRPSPRREPSDIFGRMRDTATKSIPNWTHSVFSSGGRPRSTAIQGPQDVII